MMNADTINALLRPMAVAALLAAGFLFLLGLGAIMLYRYASHGEIDWQGLVAFLGFITTFGVQHFQNRHDIKRIQAYSSNSGAFNSPGAAAGLA